MGNVASYLRACLPILLGVWSTISCLSATQDKIDSLQTKIDQSTDDSTSIHLLFQLAAAFHDCEKMDSAWMAGQRAVKLAANSENRAWYGLSLRNMAHHFRLLSESDSMAYYAEQAVEVYQHSGDWVGAASAYLDQGQAIQMQGDLASGNRLFIAAAELNLRAGADSLNDRVFINIASTFANLGDTLQEKYYLSEALRIADQYQHGKNQIIARMGLSSSFRKLGDLDTAKTMLSEARAMARNLDEPVLEGYILINEARSKNLDGDFDGAIESFEHALAIQGIPPFDQSRFRFFLTMALIDGKRWSEADQQAEMLLATAVELGALDLQLDAHNFLMNTSEELGAFRKGFYHAKRLAELTDSIFNAESQSEIRKLTLQAENDRQIKENLALRAENAENKIALLTAKSRARNRLFITLICIASLIGGIVSFFYYKKENDAQQNILSQRNQINELEIQQLQSDQEQLALKSMIEGEEIERKRIARDLHDGLGGLLSTLKISLGSLPLDSLNEQQTKIHEITNLADRASSELRQVAHNLIPESLSKFGFITAVEDLMASINYNTTIEAEFQNINLTEQDLKTDKLQLYRIVQELLNNVIKHAEAQTVFLQIMKRENHCVVVVEDDGKGFRQDHQDIGIGLENIKTRLSYLNGKISIDSQPGAGVTITLTIPFQT